MHDIGVTLEERDEGQEEAAVEAVQIELVGRQVGGRDQHQPGGEQALEQARQDHRVGDVLDLEFVEADEPHLVGDHGSDRRDRIAADPLANDVHPLMGLGHELVEMDTALGDGGGERKELVHQHGLAAADLAVDVETARRVVAPAEEPAKKTAAGRWLLFGKRAVESFQPIDDGGLRRIAADRPGRDQPPIALAERGLARARLA